MTYLVTADDLNRVIEKTEFDNGLHFHHGKVRDSFVLDENRRAIVVSDRVSAFDFILGTIPFKGQVLNKLAAWWFAQLDDLNIAHHLISVPHPNVSEVKNVTPFPIEIIVRAYLTGTTTTSSWYAYQHNDKTISGLKMKDGMKKNEIFPEPIITPTTKPEIGHDRNISRAELIAEGLVSEAVYAQVEATALKMFKHGQAIAAAQGLILVDTKYEMGLDADGALVVIDEVHTPDSSRYWIADSYQEQLAKGEEPDSLDKEFVRRMVVNNGYDVDNDDQNPKDFMSDTIRVQAAQKYLELYERMTGETLSLEASKEDSTLIQQTLRNL